MIVFLVLCFVGWNIDKFWFIVVFFVNLWVDFILMGEKNCFFVVYKFFGGEGK